MQYKRLFIILVTVLWLQSCEVATFSGEGASSTSGVLYWSIPTERMNGDSLDITEIGGYEIRYRTNSDEAFQIIRITDPNTDQWSIEGINFTGAEFEVAVFDSSGLYSEFVTATSDQ